MNADCIDEEEGEDETRASEGAKEEREHEECVVVVV